MLGLGLTLLSVLAQAVPAPASHVLIVAGVAGDPKYEQEFFDIGKQIADAARTTYSIPDSMITFLAERPERDAALIRGVSSKVGVEQVSALRAALAAYVRAHGGEGDAAARRARPTW